MILCCGGGGDLSGCYVSRYAALLATQGALRQAFGLVQSSDQVSASQVFLSQYNVKGGANDRIMFLLRIPILENITNKRKIL